MSKTPKPKRERMHICVTPETKLSIKSLNAADVARSEGAVIDVAVRDLAIKHGKATT